MVNNFVKNNFERIVSIARELEKICARLSETLPSYYNLRLKVIEEANKEANLSI